MNMKQDMYFVVINTFRNKKAKNKVFFKFIGVMNVKNMLCCNVLDLYI